MKRVLITLVSLTLLLAARPCALAQSTAFTYQGLLINNGQAANGVHDFVFTLYGDAANGTALASPVQTNGVPVTNGTFTVQLDFGASVFSGAPRWLEIAVKNSLTDGLPVVLEPRQAITPTPYAINAANLMSVAQTPIDIKVAGERALRLEPTSPWVGSVFSGAPNIIGGSGANVVSFEATGATIAGGRENVITGDGGTISGGWGGKAGGYATVGGGQYNWSLDPFSTVSGGWGNTNNREYATIAGGEANRTAGAYATIGGGRRNVSEGFTTTIAGGYGNRASSESATVGGGFGNWAGHEASTIAGGADNVTSGDYASIGGGAGNIAGPGGNSTVAGGLSNHSTGPATFIGGGENNRASGWWCSILGGDGNEASGDHATVGGGAGNKAAGDSSVVAGGGGNMAPGGYSFVGGGDANLALAHDSVVVGGDDNIADGFGSFIGGGEGNWTTGVQCAIVGGEHNYLFAELGFIGGGAGNQMHSNAYFGVISGGGGNVISEYAEGATIPGGVGNRAGGDFSLAAGRFATAAHAGAFVWADASGAAISSTTSNQFTARAAGGVRFLTDAGGTTGAELAPGSGSWSMLSDRNAKENFSMANSRVVLEKVASLSLATWNYKSQDKSVRHLGPTAQDFHAAFGLGENERTIATVDADGVALAAIQGLNQKLEEELKAKNERIESLEDRIERLEDLIRNGSPTVK